MDVKIPVPSLDGIGDALAPFVITDRVLRLWKKILFALSINQPILIIGNEGCGKSEAVAALSYLLGSNLNSLCLTPEVESSALIGQYIPNEEKATLGGIVRWHDGVVSEAFRNGYWSLLDNLNQAHAEVLERINPILEAPPHLILTEKGETTPVQGDLHFKIFATMTPSAASSSIGNSELSPALANRFTIMWMEDLNSNIDEGTGELSQLVSRLLDTNCMDQTISLCKSLLNKEARMDSNFRHIIRLLDNAYKLQAEPLFDDFTLRLMVAYRRCQTAQLSTEARELLETKIQNIFGSSCEKLAKQNEFPLVNKYFGNNGNKKSLHVLTDSRKPYAETVLVCYLCNLPVLLEGPSAVGKTSLISSIAQKVLGTGSQLERVNNTETTTVQDYIGTFLPTGSQIQFHKGALTRAMETGKWFLADEFNLAEPSVLNMLSPLLEGKRSIRVPGSGKILTAHPNFRFFATQNDCSYANRHELSKSLRNRFVEIQVENFTQQELVMILQNRDDAICDTAKIPTPYFEVLSEIYAKENVGVMITLRELIRWCRRSSLLCSRNLSESLWLEVGRSILVPQNPSYAQQQLDNVFETLSEGSSDDRRNVCKVEQSGANVRFTFGKLSFTKPGKLSNSPLFHRGIPPRSFVKHLVLLAFAFEQQEPVLLIGPTCMKTLLVKTLCEIIGRNDLNQVFLTPETEASDIVGEVHAFSYSDYQDSILNAIQQLQRLLPSLGNDFNQRADEVPRILSSGIDGERGEDDNSKELKMSEMKAYVRDLASLVDRASSVELLPDLLLRKTVVQIKMKLESMSELLASSQLSTKEKTNFQFKEGPVVSSIQTSSVLLLEDFDLPSQAVTERLNSLLETEPSFSVTEDLTRKYHDVKILPQFQLVATVHQDTDTSPLNLSPATLSRFTVIRIPGYSKNDMKEIFQRKLQQVLSESEERYNNKAFVESLCDLVEEEFNKPGSQLTLYKLFNWLNFARLHDDTFSSKTSNKLRRSHVVLRLRQGAEFCKIAEFQREGAEDTSKFESLFNECLSKLGIDQGSNEVPGADPIEDGNNKVRLRYGNLVITKRGNAPINHAMTFTRRLVIDMSYVVASIICKSPVLLEGPPGSGKTCAIFELASLLNIPCERVNLSGNVTKEELFGRIVSSHEDGVQVFKKQEGPIPRAIREGNWILLDEINLAAPELLNSLTKYLQQNYEGKGGFHIFATMNPSTTVARYKLPQSVKNLFTLIKIDQYDSKEVEAIFKAKLVAKGLLQNDLVSPDLFNCIVQIYNEICDAVKGNKLKADESCMPTLRDLVKLKDVIFGNLADQLSFARKDKKQVTLQDQMLALRLMLNLTFTRSFSDLDDQKTISDIIDKALNVKPSDISTVNSRIQKLKNVVRINSVYAQETQQNSTRFFLMVGFVGYTTPEQQ